MFGKKKTTEKKTSSAAKSTTKKPATKKPASRTTKVVSKTETKELAEYIRQKHTEEPEFQYIANEAHYDKVIEKIKDCKNPTEILKVASEEGIELTPEQLEAVSGGNCIDHHTDRVRCPRCGGEDVEIIIDRSLQKRASDYKCHVCGNIYPVAYKDPHD